MPSMEHLYRWSLAFRAKSKNHEKSNTELELLELCSTKIHHSS